MEEGADLPGFVPSPADARLMEVFGDTLHRNDGTHLSGGVADDRQWQARWRRLAGQSASWYAAPAGKVGRRFVSIFAAEMEGVRARRWNSERPLIFCAVILAKALGVRRARDIRKRIDRRMDLWEEGRYAGLVTDTEAEGRGREGLAGQRKADEESQARGFHGTVLSGKLRAAVRRATARDGEAS